MLRKFKQLLAVLVGTTLVVSFSPAISSEAVAVTIDDTWTLVDDQGYFANTNLGSSFDPDDYAVLEKTDEDSFLLTQLAILSKFTYCHAQFKVTDLDLFEDVYEEYADELQFDTISYPSSQNSYVSMYNTGSDSLTLSDEKLSLLTDMTEELDDLGILSNAYYYPVSAPQIYAQCELYLKVSLPYEDEEALNDICTQYDTEVAYFGDTDAYLQKYIDEVHLENYQNNTKLTDEEKAERIAAELDEIEALEQQMSEVSEEDSQFAIFTNSFTSQITLMNAIEDAFPEADVSFYIEYPASTMDIFTSVNLLKLAEEKSSDSDTNTDTIDIICGDANLDGKIDMADVVTLSKASSGVVDVTDNTIAAGDLDGDETLTEDDVLILLEFEMGLVRAIPLR